MTLRRTSLSKRLRSRKGFTLLELLTVLSIISILVTISVPIYRDVREDAERKVMEYNTRVVSTVLLQYLSEERESRGLSRSTVRGLMSSAIGDEDNPLYGRIDGTNLDETWFTYININYRSQEYGGFGIECGDYIAEYRLGEGIEVTNIRDEE